MRLSAGVYSYLETDLLPRCADLPSSGRPADLVPAMVRPPVRLKSARSVPAALGRRGRSLHRAAPSPQLPTRSSRPRCDAVQAEALRAVTLSRAQSIVARRAEERRSSGSLCASLHRGASDLLKQARGTFVRDEGAISALEAPL